MAEITDPIAKLHLPKEMGTTTERALQLGDKIADVPYGEWIPWLDLTGHPFCFVP